jgi:hypothetical protein
VRGRGAKAPAPGAITTNEDEMNEQKIEMNYDGTAFARELEEGGDV